MDKQDLDLGGCNIKCLDNKQAISDPQLGYRKDVTGVATSCNRWGSTDSNSSCIFFKTDQCMQPLGYFVKH